MLSAQDYLNLVNERGRQGKPLERVYRNLRRHDLFLAAYGKLYANAGAMTKGVDLKDTIDGMSLERINAIINALADGKFRWRPSRRITIPKANGKRRPLGLPNWTDKLVQEVIRRVLEAYYEPQFSTHSHGFRPARSCHTALTEIVTQWRGVRWFIEGDIKGCFDHIDHDILLGLIAEKVKDDRLIKLLREMLNAGYMEDWKHQQTYSGTPQGGVLSPLLANIYLHELDRYVEQELAPQFNRTAPRQQSQEYKRICQGRRRARRQKDRDEYRRLTKLMYATPSVDPMDMEHRSLKYVRYADDFLLGFEGPKAEAETIKQRIKAFLKERLGLELSEAKTLISHAQEQPAHFLGYAVHVVSENSKHTRDRRGVKRRSLTVMPMLRMPQIVEQRWRRQFSQQDKPQRRPELLELSDYDIVRWFQTQWSGLANYYQMAVNQAALWRVKYTLEVSLVKTLANKHQCSIREIYRRYRYKPPDKPKGIRVTLERQDRPPLVATFGTNAVRYQRTAVETNDNQFTPNIGRTQLSMRLQANCCELCGSTKQVEVHHIRKLKDVYQQYRKGQKPAWVVQMIAMRRKTLVVCRQCHLKIHAGQYDGPRLTLLSESRMM